MKNNILIFTTIFFGIFTFAQEEPETIVPENPEQLVNDSIDIQSGTIKNLQQAQERIDKLDTESKRLTNEYKDTIVEYEILNKYDNQLERITLSQAEEIANITAKAFKIAETNYLIANENNKRGIINSFNLRDIEIAYLNSGISYFASCFLSSFKFIQDERFKIESINNGRNCFIISTAPSS